VWCGCDTERCVSSVVAITERRVSYVLAFRLQFVHHFVLCYFYPSARKGAYKEPLLVLSMILFLSVVSVTVNSQAKDYRAASKICSLRFFGISASNHGNIRGEQKTHYNQQNNIAAFSLAIVTASIHSQTWHTAYSIFQNH
jgi:hypothetical protein